MKVLILSLFLNTMWACNAQNSTSQSDSSITKEINEIQAKQNIHFSSQGYYEIFQDSKGNYWFGSEGVYKYDGKKLLHYTIKDGLWSNRIRSIQEDHLGNIFIGTDKGVNKFDGIAITKLLVTPETIPKWELKSTDLWFLTGWDQEGVYRYDGEKLTFLKIPYNLLEEEFRSSSSTVSFNPYAPYSTYKDQDGAIWIGTSTFGALRFDGREFTWLSEREMTEVDPGPAPGVRAILQDEEGYFWFNSNLTHKYKMLDSQTKRDGNYYTKSEGINPALNSDFNFFCMDIDQDLNGDIWLTTYMNGVWRFTEGKLLHYEFKDEDYEVLLFSSYIDKSGKLWIGTHNSLAYYFDGEQFVKFKM